MSSLSDQGLANCGIIASEASSPVLGKHRVPLARTSVPRNVKEVFWAQIIQRVEVCTKFGDAGKVVRS